MEKEKMEKLKPVQMSLFKLDRTLAISGLIIIGGLTIWVKDIPEAAITLLSDIVTMLGLYAGVRVVGDKIIKGMGNK